MKKFILLLVMAIGVVLCLTSCEKDYYNRYYPYCPGCHCGSYYNDLCTCDCHWNDPYNKHTQSRWAREKASTRSSDSGLDSVSVVVSEKNADSINTVVPEIKESIE